MKKVLIVDDMERNRYFLEALLRGHGYETATAENGSEALEKARANLPDIIISDILMPVMDGFVLCKTWKNDDQLRSVPFVIYTATYTDPKDEAFALSIGADRFLIKPLEAEALIEEIEKLLSKGPGGPSDTAIDHVPENDFIRQHYETVIKKLEQKMAELEQLNVRLEREIAERKKIEEEIQKLNANLEERILERTTQLEAVNKRLESFSYSVSHDLRAPLRAVDGYTKILLEDYGDRLDAEGKKVCGSIIKGAQTMGKLIDDLLAFSRVDRADMQRWSVDMESLVNSVIKELATPEDLRRIDITVDALPPAIGDPSLLKQVWTNLLSNAIKFSSKKERARIEISCQDDEDELTYCVKDNGVGFDMEYAQKLFNVFQRLHSESEYEGTGVGLAIVKLIISKHGGRVWAMGKIDKGATICFTLKKK